ncbi:unnamed protein product [Amoebophrya sp. A120]|nr:unnamed protein product [Amoebophrya sp. A120]|eukprot:GSA120T00024054001.1
MTSFLNGVDPGSGPLPVIRRHTSSASPHPNRSSIPLTRDELRQQLTNAGTPRNSSFSNDRGSSGSAGGATTTPSAASPAAAATTATITTQLAEAVSQFLQLNWLTEKEVYIFKCLFYSALACLVLLLVHKWWFLWRYRKIRAKRLAFRTSKVNVAEKVYLPPISTWEGYFVPAAAGGSSGSSRGSSSVAKALAKRGLRFRNGQMGRNGTGSLLQHQNHEQYMLGKEEQARLLRTTGNKMGEYRSSTRQSYSKRASRTSEIKPSVRTSRRSSTRSECGPVNNYNRQEPTELHYEPPLRRDSVRSDVVRGRRSARRGSSASCHGSGHLGGSTAKMTRSYSSSSRAKMALSYRENNDHFTDVELHYHDGPRPQKKRLCLKYHPTAGSELFSLYYQQGANANEYAAAGTTSGESQKRNEFTGTGVDDVHGKVMVTGVFCPKTQRIFWEEKYVGATLCVEYRGVFKPKRHLSRPNVLLCDEDKNKKRATSSRRSYYNAGSAEMNTTQLPPPAISSSRSKRGPRASSVGEIQIGSSVCSSSPRATARKNVGQGEDVEVLVVRDEAEAKSVEKDISSGSEFHDADSSSPVLEGINKAAPVPVVPRVKTLKKRKSSGKSHQAMNLQDAAAECTENMHGVVASAGPRFQEDIDMKKRQAAEQVFSAAARSRAEQRTPRASGDASLRSNDWLMSGVYAGNDGSSGKFELHFVAQHSEAMVVC